jgi:site-specific DNA-methyltransferase (adenine-specific)
MAKGFTGLRGFRGKGSPIKSTQYKGDWDKEPPNKRYFEELLRVSKEQIIWGGNFFTDNLPKSGHWIFWNKRNTMPTHGDGELAWTSFNRKSVKLFEYTWNGLMQEDMKNKERRMHPTQKPVALYKWILKNYAKPGDKIIDTHVGSASSLIACYDMGFDYIVLRLTKSITTQH